VQLLFRRGDGAKTAAPLRETLSDIADIPITPLGHNQTFGIGMRSVMPSQVLKISEAKYYAKLSVSTNQV
jgi:hypothetical protein